MKGQNLNGNVRRWSRRLRSSRPVEPKRPFQEKLVNQTIALDLAVRYLLLVQENGQQRFFRSHESLSQCLGSQSFLERKLLLNFFWGASKETSSRDDTCFASSQFIQFVSGKAMNLRVGLLRKSNEKEIGIVLNGFMNFDKWRVDCIGNASINPKQVRFSKRSDSTGFVEHIEFCHDYGILQFEFRLRAIRQPSN